MRRREDGFTFLEMIMVIIILGILISIALPNYKASKVAAQEAVLMEDLFKMRECIDQYYEDKGKYPASLNALVDDGYLKFMPVDPITHQSDWEVHQAEADPSDPNAEAGIDDVHSASTQMGQTRQAPYNEW